MINTAFKCDYYHTWIKYQVNEAGKIENSVHVCNTRCQNNNAYTLIEDVGLRSTRQQNHLDKMKNGRNSKLKDNRM